MSGSVSTVMAIVIVRPVGAFAQSTVMPVLACHCLECQHAPVAWAIYHVHMRIPSQDLSAAYDIYEVRSRVVVYTLHAGNPPTEKFPTACLSWCVVV